jgi:uncharacterized protein YgiM (DUF1202 family)
MKNIIFLLIASLTLTSLSATTTPEIKTKNVVAFSGLKLRIAPGLDQQVLMVVPYGEQVTILEETDIALSVEWLEGNWTKVEYENTEGYIFNGFLTDFPIPSNDFELTQNDLQLTYPLLAWTEFHFDQVQNPDTISKKDFQKVIQYLEEGKVLTREENNAYFKSTLKIKNGQISDAYNLLKGMLLTKKEREEFTNNSVFISDTEGEIYRIKINLLSPVNIKKEKNGDVTISSISFHQGCE